MSKNLLSLEEFILQKYPKVLDSWRMEEFDEQFMSNEKQNGPYRPNDILLFLEQKKHKLQKAKEQSSMIFAHDLLDLLHREKAFCYVLHWGKTGKFVSLVSVPSESKYRIELSQVHLDTVSKEFDVACHAKAFRSATRFADYISEIVPRFPSPPEKIFTMTALGGAYRPVSDKNWWVKGGFRPITRLNPTLYHNLGDPWKNLAAKFPDRDLVLAFFDASKSASDVIRRHYDALLASKDGGASSRCWIDVLQCMIFPSDYEDYDDARIAREVRRRRDMIRSKPQKGMPGRSHPLRPFLYVATDFS